MVLDPHTAIGYGAFDKHDLKVTILFLQQHIHVNFQMQF